VGLPESKNLNQHHCKPLLCTAKLVFRTVCSTLGCRPLATTSSDTNTVDYIALLRFVAQAASLVGARRSGSAVDDSELTELYYCTLSKVQRVYSKTLQGATAAIGRRELEEFSAHA
jgi:hypothetical protein